jgi:hypothetical protein
MPGSSLQLGMQLAGSVRSRHAAAARHGPLRAACRAAPAPAAAAAALRAGHSLPSQAGWAAPAPLRRCRLRRRGGGAVHAGGGSWLDDDDVSPTPQPGTEAAAASPAAAPASASAAGDDAQRASPATGLPGLPPPPPNARSAPSAGVQRAAAPPRTYSAQQALPPRSAYAAAAPAAGPPLPLALLGALALGGVALLLFGAKTGVEKAPAVRKARPARCACPTQRTPGATQSDVGMPSFAAAQQPQQAHPSRSANLTRFCFFCFFS